MYFESANFRNAVLAPKSRTIPSSPQCLQPHSNAPKQVLNDDFEDSENLPQPLLSIAIDEDSGEDDSFQETPPRLSIPLYDGDQSGRSVEIARTATNEQPLGRFSRSSFEIFRESDRFGKRSELINDDGLRLGIDDSTIQPRLDEDAYEMLDLEKQLDPRYVHWSAHSLVQS